MVTIQEAIRWWENELSSDERNKLLPESWSEVGENTPEGIGKRHNRLLRMYEQNH